MSDEILEIVNLTKSYGRESMALTGLNLAVPRGVIFGFVGPNGAGKTTTIDILANIVKRDSGEIYLFSKPLTGKSYEYKSKTGFVLERPTYIEKLSVKEYLTFAGAMYGLAEEEAKRRTSELIKFFELEEKQDKWIETYSSGMKKKVSLAAALIHDPELLVLDEPFEGMDAVTIKKTKQLFVDLRQKGTTFLITSHILAYVESICDEVAIIHKGRIIYQNTVDSIHSDLKKRIGEDNKLSTLEALFVNLVEDPKELGDKLSWVSHEK